MQIAVLTFDGFNEIDSFVAAHILNRLRPKGWKAFITSPSPSRSAVMIWFCMTHRWRKPDSNLRSLRRLK
jgi:hypothetical protein